MRKFDFKDLMSFGMFLIALLTFIYLICHKSSKTFPVLWRDREGFVLTNLVNHTVAIAFSNYIIAKFKLITTVFYLTAVTPHN